MAGSRKQIWLAAFVLLPGSIFLGIRQWTPPRKPDTTTKAIELPASRGMVRLPGGSFYMGCAAANANSPTEQDAQPMHLVRLKPFWIDARPVTNRQFELFVEKAGFETEAERRGSSLVFDRKTSSWREVIGVDWRHPETPDSSLVGRENYPVVHVSWRDATAYADWAGKRLPTEAEFEYAARGGLNDCTYPWGRELRLGEEYLANSWQGHFPEQDFGHDGFHGTSPVGHFPPNRFGLYDMGGNVWNWCADWYADDYYVASMPDQPRGPKTGTRRVRRGGSWLSTRNYGGALAVWYRDHAPPSESTNHTGFRCARSLNAP